MSPNFAVRWWEIDTTYQVMRLFALLGIIDMKRSQKARWSGREETLSPSHGPAVQD
jgi:stearoyl-CoA desaturase (delta-9 desaturase)